MKTILDNFHEVALVVVTEDESGFSCIVSPMKIGDGKNVVEDIKQKKQKVDFGPVSGYLVVPEIIQIGLNLKCVDEAIVSEVLDTTILINLGFDVFKKANRHFVLRTSHQYVNVFIDLNNYESSCALIKVFPIEDDPG